MHISWRERLAEQPTLREFARWPAIPLDSLPRSRRKAFLRNQQIVAQVLNGEPLKGVARRHNLSAGRISQLLDRCLGGEAAAAPALTRGLIPYGTVSTKTRRQPLAVLHQPQGDTCAFQALLDEVPRLREGLDAVIETKLKDASHAQRLTTQAFHGEFKRLLADAQWPRDRYPYTTISLAYESVRQYLHKRTAALRQARQQRRASRPRQLGLSGMARRALRAIQIDEHLLDLNGRVHLQLNDALMPLRLARANVLVATDVDTHCVLGYYLAPTRHPNQQDMLTLLDDCLQPWQPLTLATPGLSYAPGACFPSGLDGAFPISFGTVQLDNALMHRAHSVIDLLCEQFGATLSLGLPATPKARPVVESVFDHINRHCSHRMAATTGSHPTDPKRESRKNRKRPPTISFQTLNEALSVILTEYNVTPQAALGDVSPLALFQHQCATQFVRYLPKVLARQWQPMISTQEVRLRWYPHEHRVPHVNFYYARYHGPGLLDAAGRHTHIRVQFDRRDIRTLHAFSLSGEDLGELQVANPWQRYPHTLATRQWIHKNIKRHRFNARDPLSGYFRWLLEHRGKPETALSLLRVYNEFTAGQIEPLVLGESDASQKIKQATQYTWQPALANHRG